MWRSLQFVRPFSWRVAGIALLALLVSALGVAEPLVLKKIFDLLGPGAKVMELAVAIGALCLLLASRTGIEAWLSVATWRTRLGVDYQLREALLGKLNTLPLTYHQSESVGGTVNRLNRATDGYVAAFSEVAFNLAPAVAYLALSCVAMVHLQSRLALIVLLVVPLPAIIGARAAKEQTQRERKLLRRWTVLYSRLNEVLDGIKTVKAFAMEEVERRRFLSGQREGNAIVERGARTDAISNALRSLTAILARIVVIGVGAWLIARGEITVGTLVAVLGYVGGLFGPVQGLTNAYQTLHRGTVSLEIIFDILDAPDAVADVAKPIVLERARGEVRFEEVGFCYADGTPVLTGLDLTVRAGETIAIVGPSGGGKTTLMLLLQRLYPLTHGRITVDGIDIRDIAAQSLRQQISVVYQDVSLFNDTVRDNIAYGRTVSSDQEIEAVARAARADEFIRALPEGYDTVVGEHGSRLSGGQKQRIGIARALLRNAPILILDEATAALDSHSERLIQEALADLTRERTTFVIAHRLATVVNADRIVVLRDGRIVELGSHAELMRENGYYASLVDSQANGLLRPHAA